MKIKKSNKCKCGNKKYHYSKVCLQCYRKKLKMGTKFHKNFCKCTACQAKNGIWKGKNSPMYGKHHSEETKKHWSKIRKGRKLSLKTKKLISKKLFGRKCSNETKKKISKANKGKNNPMYKPIGSRYINQGYWYIKIVDPNIWISFHRHKVEKVIKRKLKHNEIIHHIDGNTLNNKLSNLYLFTRKHFHTCFEVLVAYKIINRFILKSNIKKFKIKGKYNV